MSEDVKFRIDFELNIEDIENKTYAKHIKDISFLEKQIKIFLMGYVKYGVIGKAAQLAGVKRSKIDVWRRNIPKFDKIFGEMEEEYTDILEQEANRRALEKSDSLLQFMLRARRPEKFNPTQMIKADIGDGGVRIVFSESELSPEEKEILTTGKLPERKRYIDADADTDIDTDIDEGTDADMDYEEGEDE